MKWDDIQGWFTWQWLYDKMAIDVPDGGTIIEFGVWRGRSLAYLGTKLVESGKRARLVGVDLFNASGCKAYDLEYSRSLQAGDSRTLYQQCRENLDACGLPWVELIQADAIEAASMFQDNSVNHIFIDDLHNPEHVRDEIAAWLPKLRRPTWIAGDDYMLVKAGVQTHFKEVCDSGGTWVVNLK